MKIRNGFLLIGIFVGIIISNCKTIQKTHVVDKMPQLIYRTLLPHMPFELQSKFFKLETKILVDDIGDVLDVQLLNTSSDSLWDADAKKQIMKWRFTPAIFQDQPVSIWITQSIMISIFEPKDIRIARIICENIHQADSIYKMISAGENFDDMVQRLIDAGSPINGEIHDLDKIQTYPDDIKKQLSELEINKNTKPLKVGDKYVIFKKISLK